MTIKQLEYFMEVAQQLSFSRAAENLFISQSALSRSISALEEELGIILFFRNKHTVALTPAGMMLATSIPKLNSELDRAIGLVRQAKEGMRGKIEIGIQSGLGLPPVLSSAIKYFMKSLPFISVSPQRMERESLVDALSAGQIDFAVAYSHEDKAREPGADSSVLLERVPICAAVCADSPLVGRADLLDFAGHPFIFSGDEESAPVARWSSFCRSHGLVPSLSFAPNTETRALRIELGYGVGVFPATHEIFFSSSVRRVEIVETYSVGCRMLWNSANLNPSVEVFAEVINGDI